MAQPQRLKLHNLLKEILGSDNVYFQPRQGQNLMYPAIVYTMDASKVQYANNSPHLIKDRYQITYIDRSPDSDVPRKIQRLPMTRFTSGYQVDGLNHYNHSTYF